MAVLSRALTFLHRGYDTGWYWWELVVLARKYAIIAVATFVQSDIRQLHFVLAVLILSLHQHEAQKPFGRGERGGDGTDGRSGGGTTGRCELPNWIDSSTKRRSLIGCVLVLPPPASPLLDSGSP